MNEWQTEYFDNQIKTGDIDRIDYHDSVNSLLQVRKYIFGEKVRIDTIVTDNSCYSLIISKKDNWAAG